MADDVGRQPCPRCQPCCAHAYGRKPVLVRGIARSASFFVAKVAFGAPFLL